MRKRDVNRIASRHENGISSRELSLITAGCRFMRRLGVGVHVTVHLYGLPEHQRPKVFDKVKGRVATCQGRARMTRVLWLTIRETVTEKGYSLHLHLVCVFPTLGFAKQFADSLNKSAAFKRLGEKAVHAVVVADAGHWDTLSSSYFTQEATMQAWQGHGRNFPKPCNPLTGKASFPLAGDRVGASPDLKAALIRNGRAQDWTRKNARRSLHGSKTTADAATASGAAVSTIVVDHAPEPVAVAINAACHSSGSNEISEPVPASGEVVPADAADNAPAPTPAVISEPVVTPLQLSLFDAEIAPVIDIRSQVEAARRQRGLTQAEAGAQIGYRQSGYSNVFVRRHDPLGEYARRRALEWLREGQAQAA